jgi:hypothetical protein
MQAIMTATGCSASAVRDFLDGWHGRHFADDVGNDWHSRPPSPLRSSDGDRSR